MRHRNHAVNIGEFGARINLAHGPRRDFARFGGRAHSRGHDANEVPRAGSSIRAEVAIKRERSECGVWLRSGSIVPVSHGQPRQAVLKVARVNGIARRDGARSEANRVAERHVSLPPANGLDGETLGAKNAARREDRLAVITERRAFFNRLCRHHRDVVALGANNDGQVFQIAFFHCHRSLGRSPLSVRQSVF